MVKRPTFALLNPLLHSYDKTVVETPKRKRPRALTLTLPDTQQPMLVVEGRKYILRNFNEDGVGLWVPGSSNLLPQAGTQFNGDIVIGTQIFGVTLKTVHAYDGMTGLQILHRSVELVDLFRRLMEPTLYATELLPAAGNATQDPESGHLRLWYEARGQTQLLVWVEKERLHLQGLQLRWLGQYVSREYQGRAETGYLADLSLPKDGMRLRPEEVLVRHRETNPELLHSAAQFLAAVGAPLPGYLFWQFLERGESVFLPSTVLSSEAGVPEKKRAG